MSTDTIAHWVAVCVDGQKYLHRQLPSHRIEIPKWHNYLVPEFFIIMISFNCEILLAKALAPPLSSLEYL